MAVNKVTYGGNTLIDLTGDTVTPDTLVKNTIAHDASGNIITGAFVESDPTVSAWAKEPTKPSYTKSEVGLSNVDNIKQYSASNPPPYPVTSVNNKTGAITLSAVDVGALPSSTTIPNKTSQLTNNSGFITLNDIPNEIYVGNGDMPEDATIQILMDGSDEEEIIKNDLKEYIDTEIATELAKRGQLKPEFANSVEECTDTTKLYVLPDGMIWAYMLTEVEAGPSYKNWLTYSINADGSEYVGDNGEDGYRKDYRYSASSSAEKSATGYDCLGFIPAKAGDIIRIKNTTRPTNSNDGSAYAMVYFFDSGFAQASGKIELRSATYSDGIISLTIPSYSNIAYFKATLMGVSADTIITVNEEIVEGSGTTIVREYAWANTGLAFVPADYEGRILDLEEQTSKTKTDIENLKKGITISTPIKTWDAPIYDANIPVFELSTEKAAITEAEKTVAGVYAKYDALMAKHPNYITKTNLGMCSDGVIPVYRYDFRESEPHRGISGAKEWSETKTKAIIVSGIHWEWGGIFGLYNALEEIAENPALFHLRRNTHLIVLPVCNPYAVANMSVRNANLIEIHRNFEVDFIYPGQAGYIELGERSHGGTEPLSEVETRYIDNIFKENTDAALFLTCHSNQSDTVYGTGFTWASPATYYMCNMHYRIVDKLSRVWMEKYGDELAAGMADYRTENTPEWDNRLGSAYLSTTNGTETKQATKYGIQATNIEITDAFLVHGTKANPEPALSSFTMSRGAEVYVNFLLTAFGTYDPKDKALYGGEKI